MQSVQISSILLWKRSPGFSSLRHYNPFKQKEIDSEYSFFLIKNSPEIDLLGIGLFYKIELPYHMCMASTLIQTPGVFATPDSWGVL